MTTLSIPQIIYNGNVIRSVRSPILQSEKFGESKARIKETHEIDDFVFENFFTETPFAIYFTQNTFSYHFFIFDNFQGLKRLNSKKKIGIESATKDTCELIDSMYGITREVSYHLIFREFNSRNAPLLRNEVSLTNETQKMKSIAIPLFLSPYLLLDMYKYDIGLYKSNMSYLSKTLGDISQYNEDSGIALEKEQFDCNFKAVMGYYNDMQTIYQMINMDTKTRQEFLFYKNIVRYFIDC